VAKINSTSKGLFHMEPNHKNSKAFWTLTTYYFPSSMVYTVQIKQEAVEMASMWSSRNKASSKHMEHVGQSKTTWITVTLKGGHRFKRGQMFV
jgi:hypothetical protein